MTARHDVKDSDGITDHPIRAAVALLALGLVGPVVALHQQVGQLLDAATPQPPLAVAAPDVTPEE
ncbi:hypothetical protein ACX9I7_00805 [Streptomyces sp. L500]